MEGVLRYFWHSALGLVSFGMLAVLIAAGAVSAVVGHYARGLPDHGYLLDYQPPVVSRAYAGDGRLLAEFASEKRIFVPVAAIPARVKRAFLSAEDQNFYDHEGVDITAIVRAMVGNIRARMGAGEGGGLQGGSTITQQVAKNFLLTNERSLERKIREAILARRIEQAMGKERILELYLNEIYLGRGAYGVAAAALEYFGKPLDRLTVDEAAFLAALPKAPTRYDPDRRSDAARARRDWVLGRMVEDGYIAADEAATAQARPLETVAQAHLDVVRAPYFAEEVRRELLERYGEQGVYAGGLAVRTTIDPALQEAAVAALRAGLMAYDQRHGWRGPLPPEVWGGGPEAVPGALPHWRMARVEGVEPKTAAIAFPDGAQGTLPFEHARWARKSLDGQGYRLGPAPNSMDDIVAPGDVILVEPVEGEDAAYALRQVPQVQGAIIAMDPHTGRVLAMQGGWAGDGQGYNRATQAQRQPGSAFKPFVYFSALEAGFTPATLILDAPFVFEDRPGNIWAPKNYDGEFHGPTPLRVGLEKSRNLMTVRLAAYLGMARVVEAAKRFGVADDMPPLLSASLGSLETTPARLTGAYAVFANGGRAVAPTVIDRVQDRDGRTIFRHDARGCVRCGPLVDWGPGQAAPVLPDDRAQVADPVTAYQITSILEGVVQRGTGARLARAFPGRPLAGKTGTTNESRDTWFIGYTPELVAGVWVGFDAPRSLGKRETGASAALPVFERFMAAALEGRPAVPFRVPTGARRVRVNADTGARAQPGDGRVIWEVFAPGTAPGQDSTLLDEGGALTTLPAQEEGGAGGAEVWQDDAWRGWRGDGRQDRTPPGPQRQRTPPLRDAPDDATTGTGGFY
jgi:penicillin-binding protein 1A